MLFTNCLILGRFLKFVSQDFIYARCFSFYASFGIYKLEKELSFSVIKT